MLWIAAIFARGNGAPKRAAALSFSTPSGRVTMACGALKVLLSAVVRVTPPASWAMRVTTAAKESTDSKGEVGAEKSSGFGVEMGATKHSSHPNSEVAYALFVMDRVISPPLIMR
jgi:hypothetical protein